MAWFLVIVVMSGVTLKLPIKSGAECVALVDTIILENMVDRPKEVRCEVKFL